MPNHFPAMIPPKSARLLPGCACPNGKGLLVLHGVFFFLQKFENNGSYVSKVLKNKRKSTASYRCILHVGKKFMTKTLHSAAASRHSPRAMSVPRCPSRPFFLFLFFAGDPRGLLNCLRSKPHLPRKKDR